METITACENICRDFGWVGPVTEWLRNAAIIFGVFLAWQQLEAWRSEARSLKRSEHAAELIAAAYDVEDAFRFIRNPFDSIPVEDAKKPLITFERRFERLNSQRDLFRRLREAQIRSRVIIGDEDSDKAVDDLFKIRSDISLAIEVLADERSDSNGSGFERSELVEFRRTMSGLPKDEVGKKIQFALDTVVKRLSPIARLEKS